jgi:glycine/D-amino acid oxidase-like deaminating enzyme
MIVTQIALPPSLYADTAVSPTPTPPLDIDKNVSVAIIGGGFAGLSAALHLAEQRTDAIVLEAQEPGWGASGNNGGQLNPGLKLDPDTIEATFGADLGRRMIAFAYNTPVFALDLRRDRTAHCARPITTRTRRLSRPPRRSASGAACRSACSTEAPCER